MSKVMLRLLAILHTASTCLAGNLRPNIVGGSLVTTVPHSHPHLVSIRKYGYHTCGGSIVNKRIVLTAAHCFIDDTTGLYIVAGIANLTEKGQAIRIAKVRRHPKYKEFLHFDVAIATLQRPLEFNERVQAIAISEEEVGGGVECITAGWGYTKANGSVSEVLKELRVKTLTKEQCQSKQPYRNNFINDGHICTLVKVGHGVCQGDSGGSLLGNGQLIGITSWVWPCARGRPDVFTRITKCIDWIKKEISQED
ncbi:chymotrypsin-1-like isoform X2 [Photinus pyralis]|uniref:chymotrypsin-1-like isoform X2 n=1 Tax=Photinus pyralis TaxID=7054 RepID=UPI001266F23A|nr:chymotrypsin-1-like isoform X2 [Photinus pyralis]